MNLVAPRVSLAQAQRILGDPTWLRWWTRWRTGPSNDSCPADRSARDRHWELVGLPFYVLAPLPGAGVASESLSAALVEQGMWIDGHEGSCAAPARGVRFDWAEGELDIDCLPPTLLPDEARLVAADQRTRAALFLRRAARGQPALEPAACRLVHYPYWVRYVRLRGGRFDVRLADAVSGRRAGAREKRALLAGLARAAGASSSTPPLVESEVPA